MLFATSCSARSTTFSPRDPRSPLHLVRTIVLPDVHGRIDHMALNARSNHLFVAELGNGSVDDVDLASSKIVGRISGLHEPQGVVWLPAQDEIAVASGDGTVRFYRSSDRQEVARISLGDDADNVRVDPRNGDLVVGYGSGALAVIDPSTHRIVRQLKLPRHPEAFEIIGSRVFVNVPDAHAVVLADLDHARVLRTIGTGTRLGNFPIASDPTGTRIAVAFRVPGSVELLDGSSDAALFSSSACGDADDLYFRSAQIVIVCGSGAVELIDLTGAHRSLTVATERGARTGLLDKSGNELFVAVPAGGNPAAIWQLQFR
jgi:DNA-binding beta-propeller fold protein YncE